ncbi:MAG: hypothetical protein NHB32_29620 [Fischerella sp. CENA71]|nr:hypothetical protein [Fischerella sp. CENA71]
MNQDLHKQREHPNFFKTQKEIALLNLCDSTEALSLAGARSYANGENLRTLTGSRYRAYKLLSAPTLANTISR